MVAAVTKRQRDIIDWIAGYIERERNSPSFREIRGRLWACVHIIGPQTHLGS